jgi:hypothetical protein
MHFEVDFTGGTPTPMTPRFVQQQPSDMEPLPAQFQRNFRTSQSAVGPIDDSRQRLSSAETSPVASREDLINGSDMGETTELNFDGNIVAMVDGSQQAMLSISPDILAKAIRHEQVTLSGSPYIHNKAHTVTLTSTPQGHVHSFQHGPASLQRLSGTSPSISGTMSSTDGIDAPLLSLARQCMSPHMKHVQHRPDFSERGFEQQLPLSMLQHERGTMQGRRERSAGGRAVDMPVVTLWDQVDTRHQAARHGDSGLSRVGFTVALQPQEPFLSTAGMKEDRHAVPDGSSGQDDER